MTSIPGPPTALDDVFRVAWYGVTALAVWGVLRFVKVVDQLVKDHGVLHERVAVIETRLGILPELRKHQRKPLGEP